MGIYEFLKYVPDGFLNDTQKEAKQAALAKERRKIEGYKFSIKDADNIGLIDKDALDDVVAMYPQAEKGMQALRSQAVKMAGKRITKQQTGKVVRQWLRAIESSYDAETLTENLHTLLKGYYRDESIGFADFTTAGVSVVMPALEKTSGFDADLYAAEANVRDYLRNTGIRLTDKQLQAVEATHDGIGNYRKATFGKVRISNKGIDLYLAWQDLNNMRPDLFPANTSERDMPKRLEDVANALRKENYYTSVHGMGLDGAATNAFLKLVGEITDSPQIRNSAQEMERYAQKQYDTRQKEVNKALVAVRQAISKQYNAAQKAGDRAKMKELLEDYRKLTDGARLREANRALVAARQEISRQYNAAKEAGDRAKMKELLEEYRKLSGGSGSGNLGQVGQEGKTLGRDSGDGTITAGEPRYVETIDLGTLDEKLKEYEDSMRNLDHERAYIIDKAGRVYVVDGNVSNVNLGEGDLDGCIITHNHPIRYGEIGGSFGKEDFIFLTDTPEIRQLRAVDAEYVYSVSLLRDVDISYSAAFVGGGGYVTLGTAETVDLKHYVFLYLAEKGYVRYERTRI